MAKNHPSEMSRVPRIYLLEPIFSLFRASTKTSFHPTTVHGHTGARSLCWPAWDLARRDGWWRGLGPTCNVGMFLKAKNHRMEDVILATICQGA